MNPDPHTPPPVPTPTTPWPPAPSVTPPSTPRNWKNPFLLEPMAESPTALNSVASLLKAPGRVLYQIGQPGGSKLALGLLVISIFCLLAFGFLLGTFSGGAQLWAAPTKVVLGTLASGLICLPSLVIFALLSGTECSLSRIVALLGTMLALVGVLLVGFAPVVWVFAQSSSEVGFMGSLGVIFWILACLFGLRMLANLAAQLGSRSKAALFAWGSIFLLVSFQMTATLRPILGRSATFLPTTKMGFLKHWLGQPEARSED